MKKSTIKLILLAIAGCIISYACYSIGSDVELSFPYAGPARKLIYYVILLLLQVFSTGFSAGSAMINSDLHLS